MFLWVPHNFAKAANTEDTRAIMLVVFGLLLVFAIYKLVESTYNLHRHTQELIKIEERLHFLSIKHVVIDESFKYAIFFEQVTGKKPTPDAELSAAFAKASTEKLNEISDNLCLDIHNRMELEKKEPGLPDEFLLETNKKKIQFVLIEVQLNERCGYKKRDVEQSRP